MDPVQKHAGILKFLAAEDRGVEGCWLVTEYHPFGSIYDYLKAHNSISPQALLRISGTFCHIFIQEVKLLSNRFRLFQNHFSVVWHFYTTGLTEE